MYCLLSDDECSLILSKTLKNTACNLVKFEFKKFSDNTLGYLGEHLLLNVFYRISGEPDVRENSYFVKAFPQENNEQKQFVESLGVIRKEVDVYEKVISKIQPLVSDSFCASFYYGRDDIIVFENLQSRGFKMLNKIYLDKIKVKAGLRTMALMHAASIQFEENRKSTDEQYELVNECKEDLTDNKNDFVEGHPRNNWYKVSAKCVADLCAYFTGDKCYKNKILDYFKFEMPKLDHISIRHRNVFCHNDLWINNIMFNDSNECLFVDFQLAKYGPPAFDFWGFLYFNTNYESMQQNLEEFINFYYNTLKNELQKSSIDILNILTKNAFLKSIEDYAMPVLFQVCACGTYIFTPDSFIKSMMEDKVLYEDFNFGNRSKYILEQIEKDAYCQARFKNLILPLSAMFTQ